MEVLEVCAFIVIYGLIVYFSLSFVDTLNILKLYYLQFKNMKIGDIYEIKFPDENLNVKSSRFKIVDIKGQYIYYTYDDANKGELVFKNHYLFFMWAVNKY